METKQVIVLRKDLNMRKGKMVAQGAHASMKVILDNCNYSVIGEHYELKLPKPMLAWVSGKFTKVVVGVDSEQELIDVYNAAFDAKLPCSLIEDAGLTEFNGIPTFTAVAVGPAENFDIDMITSELKLL